MRVFSDAELHAALDRVPDGLSRYRWLQARVFECDVRSDPEFQRRFNRFYRVRRGGMWRAVFFELLEYSKTAGIDFAQALRFLADSTGRLEASFASKLVATLDPSKPVVDKFVLMNFGLELPHQKAVNRTMSIIEVYERLILEYTHLMMSPQGERIRAMFDEKYPGSGISELKKIDLVLWQAR